RQPVVGIGVRSVERMDGQHHGNVTGYRPYKERQLRARMHVNDIGRDYMDKLLQPPAEPLDAAHNPLLEPGKSAVPHAQTQKFVQQRPWGRQESEGKLTP